MKIISAKKCALFAMLALLCGALPAWATTVFWASSPVQPNDTVLLLGDGFSPDARVTFTRLADASGKASKPASAKPIQAVSGSLKAIVPAGIKMGLFEMKVATASGEATCVINEPQVWWNQADRGETGTAGGWVQIMGRCLGFSGYCGMTDAPASAVRIADKDGKKTTLRVVSAGCWSVKAKLPDNLPDGVYSLEIHNGFGGDAGWRSAGELTVTEPQWPMDVFDAKKMGLEKAVEAAAKNGGGIVYLPRGVYKVDPLYGLTLPPKTILRGENKQVTFLISRNIEDRPEAFITGTEFAVEDLSIYLDGNYPHVLRPADGAKYFAARRLIIRARGFFTHWPWMKKGQYNYRYNRISWSNLADRSSVQVFYVRRVRNVEISNCDIDASGLLVVKCSGMVYARIADNTSTNGAWQFWEDNDYVILENNRTIQQMALGGITNHFYSHGNEFANYQYADREIMTTDVGWSPFFGTGVKVDGTTMTLPRELVGMRYKPNRPNAWVGYFAAIVTGKGAGQIRTLTETKDNVVKLDKPFAVPPDENSVVSLIFPRRYLIFDSDYFHDSGSFQLYGASFDTVMSGCRYERADGLLVWPRDVHEPWEPTLRSLAIGNRIAYKCPWGQAWLRTFSSHVQDNYDGPLGLGIVFRNNTIEDASGIGVRGGINDVIVENNLLVRTEKGIELRGYKAGKNRAVRIEPDRVLLRRNTFKGGATGVSSDLDKSKYLTMD